MPNDTSLLNFGNAKKAVAILPHEAKALLKLFCLQSSRNYLRQNSSSSSFASWSKIKIHDFTLADQDWIGLMIFKNFAYWIGFNFIGLGLDSDSTNSQSAHLCNGATLSPARCATEPGHLFHSALIRPSSAVARRLKLRHPFVPVAQQLISFSENNNIRAEQWAVLNSCCILNMKRLVTLKYKQRKTSKASQESDLEACQWFHGITMISTNIGTPKVISPNGLKTKRMKLEQSDN